MTRGFSMRFCFQTVMNGMPPQPMFRRSVRRDVELAAQPAATRLGVAGGQALRHGADQDAHPVEVAAFEVGEAGGFQ